MKVLILELNGKKYTTGKITAWLSKEATKIQKTALDVASDGKKIDTETETDENLQNIKNVLSQLEELRDRKTALIVETYGNQFTADEFEKALSDEEIDEQINSIISGIHGILSKN